MNLSELNINSIIEGVSAIAVLGGLWLSYSRTKTNAEQKLGQLQQTVSDMKDAMDSLQRMAIAHQRHVTEMDQLFWREKWPQVVEVVQQVKGISHRLDDLSGRIERHDDRISSLERRAALRNVPEGD